MSVDFLACTRKLLKNGRFAASALQHRRASASAGQACSAHPSSEIEKPKPVLQNVEAFVAPLTHFGGNKLLPTE